MFRTLHQRYLFLLLLAFTPGKLWAQQCITIAETGGQLCPAVDVEATDSTSIRAAAASTEECGWRFDFTTTTVSKAEFEPVLRSFVNYLQSDYLSTMNSRPKVKLTPDQLTGSSAQKVYDEIQGLPSDLGAQIYDGPVYRIETRTPVQIFEAGGFGSNPAKSPGDLFGFTVENADAGDNGNASFVGTTRAIWASKENVDSKHVFDNAFFLQGARLFTFFKDKSTGTWKYLEIKNKDTLQDVYSLKMPPGETFFAKIYYVYKGNAETGVAINGGEFAWEEEVITRGFAPTEFKVRALFAPAVGYVADWDGYVAFWKMQTDHFFDVETNMLDPNFVYDPVESGGAAMPW